MPNQIDAVIIEIEPNYSLECGSEMYYRKAVIRLCRKTLPFTAEI